MINHAEAQSLISARLDEPLDPIVARELDAHLATCPQCRAFASQTAAMSRALQGLPYLPASPKVRRAVLDATQKPVTPMTRLQGFFAPVPGSALSTVAAVVVVGILSLFVITRLLGNHDGGDQQTALLAPSVETTRQSDIAQDLPTATEPMTAPALPTDTVAVEPSLAATEPPNVVTAPTEPDVTAPPTPTELPPTETIPPPTLAPTEPVSTEPVETSTAESQTAGTDAGSNSIRIAAGNAAATESPETGPVEETPATEPPTEEPVTTPTLTAVPTSAPTEDLPPTPTETPIPPTSEPTATPTTGSPRIESTTGTYEPAAPGDEAASPPVSPDETAIGPTPDTGPQIEPASTEPGGDLAPTIGPANQTPGQDQSVPNDGTGGATNTAPNATADASTEGQTGDPGSVLGSADPGTRITAAGGEWAPLDLPIAPQTSPDGSTVSSERQGQLEVCGADGTCSPLGLPGGDNSRTSATLIGWLDSTAIVAQRSGDGQASYVAIPIDPDGSAGEAIPLGTGGSSTGTAYQFGDALLIETTDGWFTATATGGLAVTTEPPVAGREQLRLYPDRGYVAFVSDGAVLVENVNNGYIVGKVPASGIDFDLSASDQVAISTGTSIEIWDLNGDRLATYVPPSGDQIGSVAWSGDSILYVDTTTGEVRSIAPSDFGPDS